MKLKIQIEQGVGCCGCHQPVDVEDAAHIIEQGQYDGWTFCRTCFRLLNEKIPVIFAGLHLVDTNTREGVAE